MIRIAIVFICTCALASPLSAMVGGAPPTSEGAGRAVVMLTGSHGTFCSGVALARDLVLTAAHCVLPGANYKLIEFDTARQRPHGLHRHRDRARSRAHRGALLGGGRQRHGGGA